MIWIGRNGDNHEKYSGSQCTPNGRDGTVPHSNRWKNERKNGGTGRKNPRTRSWIFYAAEDDGKIKGFEWGKKSTKEKRKHNGKELL